MTEKPDIRVNVETNSLPYSVALDYGDELELFTYDHDIEHIEECEYVFNTWDAELYKIDEVMENVVTFTENGGKEVQSLSREWFELDHERLLPMKEL
jgi:K+/H+ antiporter YhaU regulatory subunit KhtT